MNGLPKSAAKGKTASLDIRSDEGISQDELTSSDSPLAKFGQRNWRKSLRKFKPPMGDILSEFLFSAVCATRRLLRGAA